LKDHTAGDPQKEDVIWTDLSDADIKNRLKDMGIMVGMRAIKQLLLKHNYKKRKIQRRNSIKQVANRNEQFEKISQLKQEYIKSKNPIVSIDTKKKN